MGRMEIWTENGFRTIDGVPLQTKETYQALNKVLRSRNDIELRILFTRTDVIPAMKEAEKLARLASKSLIQEKC